MALALFTLLLTFTFEPRVRAAFWLYTSFNAVIFGLYFFYNGLKILWNEKRFESRKRKFVYRYIYHNMIICLLSILFSIILIMLYYQMGVSPDFSAIFNDTDTSLH